MKKLISIIVLLLVVTTAVFADKVIACKKSFGDEMTLIDEEINEYAYVYGTRDMALVVLSESELELTKLYIKGVKDIKDDDRVRFVEEDCAYGRIIHKYYLYETLEAKIKDLYSKYKELQQCYKDFEECYNEFDKGQHKLPDNWRDMLETEDSEHENVLYWYSYWPKYVESSGFEIYSFKDYMMKWWGISISDNWEELMFLKYNLDR